MTVAYQRPTYAEVSAGTPFVATFVVETGTSVTNGAIVTYGTTQREIAVAGDECLSPLGWVSRDHTNMTYAESDRSTDYTAAETVGVVRGPIIVISKTSDTAIKAGNELCCSSSGEVKVKASNDTCPTVGFAVDDYASSLVLVRSTL